MRPLLEFRHVDCGTTDSTHLRNASFLLLEGEFVSIVGGDNSGGKLIMDVLSGALGCTKGEVLLLDAAYAPHDIADANKHGVYCISLANSLIESQSIAENFFVNTSVVPLFGLVRKKENYEETKRLLAHFGLDFDPLDPIRKFSANIQTLLQMIKFMRMGAKLIVLSNVMKNGSVAENELFLKVVERMIDQRISILFLTNQCTEMLRYTSRTLLLSQTGRIVKTIYPEDFDQQAIKAYLASSRTGVLPRFSCRSDGKVILRTDSHSGGQREIVLREGEVLGVLCKGEGEYGRHADMRYGLGLLGRRVWLDGKLISVRDEEQAARNGIGMIPDDLNRLYCPDLSIEDNVLAPFLGYAGNALGILKKGNLRALRQDMEHWFGKIELEFGFIAGDECIYSIMIRFLMFPYRLIILTQPSRVNDKRKVDMLYWMMNILLQNKRGFIVISASAEELDAVASNSYEIEEADQYPQGEEKNEALRHQQCRNDRSKLFQP